MNDVLSSNPPETLGMVTSLMRCNADGLATGAVPLRADYCGGSFRFPCIHRRFVAR